MHFRIIRGVPRISSSKGVALRKDLSSRTALIVSAVECLLFIMSSAVSAATLTVGVGKQYAFPSQAIAAAHDGDTIAIDAGTYANDYATISHNNLTLVGVGGKARLVQTTKANIPNGKGIWVVYGNNVTIDNIEFTGAHVKDKNGAGIRMQGGDITIKNSYFRDNQDGILGGENANVTAQQRILAQRRRQWSDP